MTNPELVKTSQTFTLKEIIHNQEGFSIGIGRLIGSEKLTIGMRWNGNDEKVGFPYAGKNPLWFTLPPSFTSSILNGLLVSDVISQETYVKILSYLEKYKFLKKTEKQIETNNNMFDELFDF